MSLIVEALLAQMPEESAPAVIVVKPERPSAGSRASNGRTDGGKSNYDPGMMYLLELATILTLRDSQTLEALGERLLTTLQAFIRDARNIHSLALSRIIHYLLNLLLRLSHVCQFPLALRSSTLTSIQDQPFIRVPVILHGISGFDQDILESVAVTIVKSFSRCISSAGLLRNEITVSPDFWSILQRLLPHKEAAPLVFDLLRSIVESNPPIITADNYESAVSLANDFISAGSVGYIEERQRDAHGRRGKAVKPSKPRYVYLTITLAQTQEN